MIGKFILGLTLIIACGSSLAADDQTFNVRKYGAKGDGQTKDTAALQRALDACATNGGGTVIIPEGVYLTGSLLLGSHTSLELQKKSCLVGSPDIADYPLQQVRWEGEFRGGHRALLSATQTDHLAITGPGVIFGPPINISNLRNPRGPVLIELTDCTNTVLENFTTQYERLWSIHLLFCQNLTVNGLIIRTVSDNGDGIDVDSCRDILIEHTTIDTGDDAISLKSGRGLAAEQLGRPTENITIRDCSLNSSIDAGLGIGTEMSGGIRNVRLENCTISGHQNAIYFKSRDGRGGFMENITGDNLVINDSPTFIGIDLLKKGIQATDPVPGDVAKWSVVKNLSFRHVQLNHVAEIVAGKNIPPQRILDGLTLTDIAGTCSRGISLANMTNVKIANLNVTGFYGPLINTENVKGDGLGKGQWAANLSGGKSGHRIDVTACSN